MNLLIILLFSGFIAIGNSIDDENIKNKQHQLTEEVKQFQEC